MRNLTLRFMLAAAAVLVFAAPFSAQTRRDSKKKGHAQGASAQKDNSAAKPTSCPMAAGATGAAGDMMKNMPMGDMMKNMPMGDMMKNMPMGDMMKKMPMGGMMGNQSSTPGDKKP